MEPAALDLASSPCSGTLFELRYAGKVGTGFNTAGRLRPMEIMQPLE